MMSIIYRKSLPHALVIPACTLLLMFGAAVAFAQTTDLPEGVTQAQIDGALEDISALYGSPVVRTDQARAICNEEQYFLACAEIGAKHDLFDADRAEQVDTLVAELKGDVADRIAECSTVECLMDVATSIARDLSRSNPSVARAVELTSQNVEAKQAIVDAAKELGVDFEACRTMDPETASVDLLRACARLAKDTRVQSHIPEASRGRTDNADATIELKENLASGEVQCGNGTLEGCGDFCLNPSAEARAQGAAAIPQVCRDIAQRFFGPEGVTHLEDAYTAVQDTFNNISQRQGPVFTTPDGQTLTNHAAIGRYLEAAGQRGDVAAIEKGMDFMIANGFAKAADKDFAVKMVQKIQERGAINFDECRTNPEACRDFVPEDHQGGFAAMGQVEKIMRTSMANLGVTDPSRCEFDHSIGQACMDGARAALPQIRALAGQYPQLNAMIADLEQKIRFGEEAFTARSRAEDRIQTGGTFTVGGQQFSTMADLEAFCRTNSQACLAEAARSGVFSRDVAAEKYQYAAERQYQQYNPNNQFTSAYEPRPAYEDMGSLAPQPPQFDKEAARQQFEAWLDNPTGPPPSFANTPYPPYPGDPRGGQYPPYNPAIGAPYPMPYYPNQCPQQSFPRPCPAGEYRQESVDARGCYTAGACIPFATQTQPKSIDGKTLCPAMPTVESCPAGQEKIASFSSPECGTYYMCDTKRTTGTQVTYPYTFGSGKVTPSYEAARMYCYESGLYGATTKGDVGECAATFGFSVPPMPPEKQCSQYGNGWYPVDSSGNCFSPDKIQYRGPRGTLRQCSSAPVYGCGNATVTPCPAGSYWDGYRCTTSDPLPVQGQTQQAWNNLGLQSSIRTDADPARIASLKQSCANVRSSQNIWMPGAGDYASKDFGMPDPAKCAAAASCTGDQYFDGTKCVAGGTTTGSCPSYTSQSTCSASSGCSWNSTSNYCSYGTATTCPSGQYWSGTSCVTSDSWPQNDTTASGMQRCFYPNASINGTYPGYTVWCEKDYYNCHVGDPSGATVSLTGLTLGAPSTCESGLTGTTNSCPSGQYWDGTKCGTAAEGCVRAGGTWDSATSYCKMPSSASSCGTYTSMSTCSANSACRWDPANYCASNTTTTTTCPSGQYWNGSSCVSNTTVTGSCSSELTGLLGTGCHNMGNAWFNGEMTQYVMPNTTVVNYCASSWVSGCSGSTTTGGCPSYTTQSTCTAVAGACSWNSTSNYCSYSNTSSCPSGQYWNGSSCVNNTTTTCASGQYWNGSACVTSTYSSDPQTACAQGGGTWNSSTSYCQMPNSTACPSGQYWNGSSCVNNTTTTCASGQYWNGTACVNTSSTDCPSGQYWNGSSCVTTDYSSAQSGCTSAGGTWDSTANYCNMPTSYFCPSGHGWDGSHCTFAQQPTQEKFTASVLSAFLSLLGIRW